ncbi:sensor domain-containing diguanylate cyclase [Paracandidimonas soli]|uniref:PAS domain S-box-containing protein/diguanylate cyclase (GGDEF)-like protein n=1 Tax=Paracandidimonas soli TaxID=1917182 RepID=A0A4R3VC25_9BURK|nr:diguanylate cyclase [Paracandidimonas soli]TCV01353.1 PAS domain S-box-containing protein/diguanylate cyclase (GGDEF)-like protein [Paracandidimonas soli]
MIRLKALEVGDAAVQPAGAFWRRLLRMTLSPVIVLVCATVVVALWWMTMQRIEFEREQAIEAAMKSNANLAIAFEQQVSRTLQAAEQMAAFVREQYLSNGKHIDLRNWVENRIIREETFNIISVVDETGAVVSSSKEGGLVNYADRKFFLMQRNNRHDTLFINEPVIGRVTGRWQVPMSMRISPPDGSFAGVVVMSVDPSSFSVFYHQTDLGDKGLMELVDLDGVVFERKLGEHSSFGVDVRDLHWFQRRLDEPAGDFIDDGAALDGVVRIVSYRRMRDYPLMVTVGVSYDDEMTPVRQRRISYLALASVATAALLILSALLMWALARQRAVANALLANEALFRATFNQAAMGIAHIAPDGRILGVNEKFCRMLGYSRETLCGLTVYDLGNARDGDRMRQFIAQRLSSNARIYPQEIEKAYRRGDGSLLWVCEALSVVRNSHGKPKFLVAVTQDITARKELEERLSHDAMHDALTRLPNRVMFHDRLSKVLAFAHRHDTLAAVLYLDLDGFKEVNDSYGHAVGDVLLQQVAERLRNSVREEDMVARLGGDEFAIVLPWLSDERDCGVVAEKVIAALSEPFHLKEGPAVISASVGVAVFPVHGQDVATLVVHADGAMYAAKHAGKNRYCYEPLRA